MELAEARRATIQVGKAHANDTSAVLLIGGREIEREGDLRNRQLHRCQSARKSVQWPACTRLPLVVEGAPGDCKLQLVIDTSSGFDQPPLTWSLVNH